MGSTGPPIVPEDSQSPPTTNGSAHIQDTSLPPLSTKATILHLGDPIQHNHEIYARLLSQFHVINPPAEDLERTAFEGHLRKRTWGDFSAIMRPFWRSGNTMAPWDEELIKLLPDSMQVMASAGAGYDWVNDQCLAEHGILYCNGAHASTESVADTALWLIISVFRHMTASALAARSCSPTRWIDAHNHVPTISHNPSKHTLGIIGLGNIGFAIAEKAHLALGMKILYTDILRKPPAREAQVNATYFPDMATMLPYCDCVLLATPAGPPLLTASTISLLPRGARIVNIARGSLIDETALADALDRGHIDAAGLDVHAAEPRVNARLARMDSVMLTCHTGGGSVETNIGFERLSMVNCEAVLNGGKPLTAVNLHWFKQPARIVRNEDNNYRPGGGGGVDIDASVPLANGEKHDERSETLEGKKPTVVGAPTDDSCANTTLPPLGSSTPNPSTSLTGQTQLETPSSSTITTPPVKNLHDADHTNGVT